MLAVLRSAGSLVVSARQLNAQSVRRHGNDDQWSGYLGVLRRLLANKGAQEYWTSHRESYSKTSRDFVSKEFGL